MQNTAFPGQVGPPATLHMPLGPAGFRRGCPGECTARLRTRVGLVVASNVGVGRTSRAGRPPARPDRKLGDSRRQAQGVWTRGTLNFFENSKIRKPEGAGETSGKGLKEWK